MAGLGPHWEFIVGAWAVAALVIAALVAWVVLDHRSQRAALAGLDAEGRGRPAPRRPRSDERAMGEPA